MAFLKLGCADAQLKHFQKGWPFFNCIFVANITLGLTTLFLVALGYQGLPD
jgi:hypothetical protein